MSAASIARWKAIPLERDEEAEKSSNKRPHSVDNDEEDDVSLISRSPTPPKRGGTPPTYDEEDRSLARDVVTVHTRLSSTNKGHSLLLKMGWKEGQGLGLAGEGRPDPIPFVLKSDSLGLGKLSQDLRVAESTVAQRRNIESERQAKETVEQRLARQSKVAQTLTVQAEVKDTIRLFYCELCSQQFSNIAQYDEHTRGYAHAHKQRMKDQQAAQRAAQDSSKRKEKERKREEKELRKIATAAGVKIATSGVPSTYPPSEDAPAPSPAPEQPSKKGWKAFAATVTAPPLGPPPVLPEPPPGDFKKAGGTAVGARTAPGLPRPAMLSRAESSRSRSSVRSDQPPPPVWTPPPPPPPGAAPPLPRGPSPSYNSPSFPNHLQGPSSFQINTSPARTPYAGDDVRDLSRPYDAPSREGDFYLDRDHSGHGRVTAYGYDARGDYGRDYRARERDNRPHYPEYDQNFYRDERRERYQDRGEYGRPNPLYPHPEDERYGPPRRSLYGADRLEGRRNDDEERHGSYDASRSEGRRYA